MNGRFPIVGDGTGSSRGDMFYREEVQLALRNRGMPLEGLRYPITPLGLHYLLIHFDIPHVDINEWRLKVAGMVAKPMEFTLDEIQKRPAKTITVTMECAGDGRALLNPRAISQPWFTEAVGTAKWTGTPLWGILEEAGLDRGVVEILLTGLDEGVQQEEIQFYQRSLGLEEVRRSEVLLAYEMNDEPLPPQHGFPLRLLVPGWYGMASVKWLSRIEAVGKPFQGYQMAKSYRYSKTADDPGEPVTLIKVRALMVPPGIPDFLTRVRLVRAGSVELTGRAWAGKVAVARVEVSVDGGVSWADADLQEGRSPYAWKGWSYRWDARPGRYALCVKATDENGQAQPFSEPWNFLGMGNNMVQQVNVLVESGA